VLRTTEYAFNPRGDHWLTVIGYLYLSLKALTDLTAPLHSAQPALLAQGVQWQPTTGLIWQLAPTQVAP
jgi:hypothetical protein